MRKWLLTTITILVLMLMLLSGCGGKDTGTGNQVNTGGDTGGTTGGDTGGDTGGTTGGDTGGDTGSTAPHKVVTFAWTQEPDSLNPDDMLFSLNTIGHGSLSQCILRVDLDHDLVIVQIRKTGGPRYGEWVQKFFQTISENLVKFEGR